MGKILNNNGQIRCLFNKKFLILLYYTDCINVSYRIDDNYFFLRFSPATKEFEKIRGFGNNEKTPNTEWWKNPGLVWKEMSE